MKVVLITLGVLAAGLVLAVVGFSLWLNYVTTPKREVTQQTVSAKWVAVTTEETSRVGPDVVGSTDLAAYPVGKPEEQKVFLGVQHARAMQLTYTDANTLHVVCRDCGVFLLYEPPPGLTVHYDITDPSQPGKQY